MDYGNNNRAMSSKYITYHSSSGQSLNPSSLSSATSSFALSKLSISLSVDIAVTKRRLNFQLNAIINFALIRTYNDPPSPKRCHCFAYDVEWLERPLLTKFSARLSRYLQFLMKPVRNSGPAYACWTNGPMVNLDPDFTGQLQRGMSDLPKGPKSVFRGGISSRNSLKIIFSYWISLGAILATDREENGGWCSAI